MWKKDAVVEVRRSAKERNVAIRHMKVVLSVDAIQTFRLHCSPVLMLLYLSSSRKLPLVLSTFTSLEGLLCHSWMLIPPRCFFSAFQQPAMQSGSKGY